MMASAYDGITDGSSLTIDSHSDLEDFPLSPSGFVNEIDYNELQFLEVVGKGAYGSVQKARWRNKIVAIKIPENQSDTKEFRDEAQQLSLVRHKNIIRLFGSVNRPKVCLVMEYANCGSLHALLHPPPEQSPVHYTLGHVMSWAYQCAQAVEYLHNIKPKPIIHRDLKPPNMLLSHYGTVLKICDFGTACHPRTEMSCNKGSASWMAPEVFEGTRYAEKCDVYSFGIVLWEMLTRKKPFDKTNPFQIMWKVHEGTRPPPINGIPACLENLMQGCWEKADKDRPTFIVIAEFFRKANKYVSGGDKALFGGRPSVEPVTCWDHSEENTSVSLNNKPTDAFHPRTSFQSDRSELSIPGLRFSPGSPVRPVAGFASASTTPSPNRDRVDPPYIELSPICLGNQITHSIGRTISLPALGETLNRMPPGMNPEMDTTELNLIPPELMPVIAIKDDPKSEEMYETYMEGLKKYAAIQRNIACLSQCEIALQKNIDAIRKEHNRNSQFIADYVKQQNIKQNLLDFHSTLKPLLEQNR